MHNTGDREETKARMVYKSNLPGASGQGAAVPDTLTPPQQPPAPGTDQSWIYLDVGKVLAVLCIVVLHVTAGAWAESTPGTFNWHVLNVFYCLSRIGMPLFFMQVGALLLNQRNDMPLRAFYKTHVLRLVSAFFIWSALYMLTYYLFDAPGGFADFTPLSFFTGLLGGAPYAWFILLAISLYLVIPILRAVARDMTVCKYFLVLWAIFSILHTTLYRIPVLLPGLPAPVGEGVALVANTFSQIKPEMVVEFPGYMLLGYYLHKTDFSRKATVLAVLLGLAGLAYTLLMTIIDSIAIGSPSESFFGNFSINIVLMTIAAAIGVKALIKKVRFGPKTYRGLRFFSDLSFGIFLIHDFLRMGLVRVGINALTFPPLLAVPVLSIVVFAASGGIAYWLKNIPKAGPYIVGG